MGKERKSLLVGVIISVLPNMTQIRHTLFSYLASCQIYVKGFTLLMTLLTSITCIR